MSPNSYSLRAQQSGELLTSKPKFTFDEFVTAKMSTHVLLTDRVLDELLAIAKNSDKPLVQQAVDVLSKWDRRDDNDSRGALLFERWASHFVGPQFLGQDSFAHPWTFSDPRSTPRGIKDPAAAINMLEGAAKETIARYGSLDRSFGEVSRFHIGDVNVPGNGGFGNTGVFRVITWGALKGGERTPIHGETYIAMVEFSKPIKAMGLITYGESSQPGSKHAGDQLPLLSQKRLRPIWLSEAEVASHAEQRKTF